MVMRWVENGKEGKRREGRVDEGVVLSVLREIDKYFNAT